MLGRKQCCGTCKYGSYDPVDGYVCVNYDSEYVADFVEYRHTCDEWTNEPRGIRNRDNENIW